MESNRKKTFFFRTLDDECTLKLQDASKQVIELLMDKLKLKSWEALIVIESLYKSFPVQEMLRQRETKP